MSSFGSRWNWKIPWLRCSRLEVKTKNPISTATIFLSRGVETVLFFFAGYNIAAHKILPVSNKQLTEKRKIKNAAKSIKNALTITCKCAYLLVIPGRFELPTYRLGVLIMLKLSLLYVIFLRFVQKFTVQSVYFVNFFRMFSIHSIRISPFFVLRFLYYFLYVHCV